MTAFHDWGRKPLHPPHYFKRRRRTHEWLRQFSVPILEAMALHQPITMVQIAADCAAELNSVRTLLGLGIQGNGADLWLFGHGPDRYVQAVINNVDIMMPYMTAVEELEIRRRLGVTRQQLFAKWKLLPKGEEHDEDHKARFPIRLERDELLDGLGLDEMVEEVQKIAKPRAAKTPAKKLKRGPTRGTKADAAKKKKAATVATDVWKLLDARGRVLANSKPQRAGKKAQ